MAKAGAVAGLEDELTCPICLGVYHNPVTLSCGHSFCKECIQEARSCLDRPQSSFRCPLCCMQADLTTELQPNIQLRSIVQKLLDASAHQEEEKHEEQCEEKGESSGQQDEVVPCDFCLQETQPAVKMCLSCEASLCQAHLRKHNTKSFLKDHVLTEPCGAHVLAEMRCLQHGKLLECYCETESMSICMLCCVTSSHKNHKIITSEEAFGRAQSAFPETLETAKKREAALDQIITNLLKQEEEVKTKETLQRNQLETFFGEMHLQLDSKKEEVLKALSRKEEQQLSQIQMEIQKHKEVKDAASHDVQELEALRDQKNVFVFVKAFAAIQARERKPVPRNDGVKLPEPSVILDESTRDTTLRLFQQFLSEMQSLFKGPPIHEHLTVTMNRETIFAVNVTEIAASLMQSYLPPAPTSFKVIPHVRSNQTFSEGCRFWNVDTSRADGWKLGVANCHFECYLQKSRNALSVFLGETMITRKAFPADLKCVRVELDCRRNTLSFYNVSVKDGRPTASLRLIETVNIPLKAPVCAILDVSDGCLKLL